MRRRHIAFLVIAFLAMLWVVTREQPVTIQQQPPIRVYRYYLPFVVRDYPRHPLRGVAASGNGGAEAVAQTGASFYLNWQHLPSGGMGNAEFIPMVNAHTLDLPDLIADSNYLLTANEPNIWGQAQVCPAEYVTVWREIETRWGDRWLVSPGVGWAGTVWCDAPDGKTRMGISGVAWLTDFREFYWQRYDEYPRFDVLSWHCYPPPESPCDALVDTQKFIALADAWEVSEVWITETDAGKNGGQDLARFDRWMDYWAAQPKITRIAYYQDALHAFPDNSPLVDISGIITAYGKFYGDSQ